MVPRAGIEPARCFQRGILSPVRLPIPPSRQHGGNYRRFAAIGQPPIRDISVFALTAEKFDTH